MNRGLVAWAAAIMSLAFLSAACSSGGSETETTAADSGAPASGDAANSEGEGTDAEPIPPFQYDDCADPTDIPQYPTPAWEQPGESLTGVILAPPEDDAATLLLEDARPEWPAQFSGTDGFPLSMAWFIAVTGEPTGLDPTKVKLYAAAGGELAEIENLWLTGEVFDGEPVVLIRSMRPLPTSQQGQRYVLAIYDGGVLGAQPVPPCGIDNFALPEYVAAATQLTAAGKGEGLGFALPFTASRASEQQANLYQHLAANPVLQIEKIEQREYDSYGEMAPSAETVAVLAPRAFAGVLVTPAYQDADGVFVIDYATGVPQAQGETKPGFLLVLPAQGAPPFPVVLFQHGGSRYPEDLFAFVKPYAENGIAMIGIDLPFHGNRAPAGGGGDFEMADFDNPLKSRDNFRQASADHLAVLTGAGVLNESLKQFNGADQTLDAGRVFFMGHSMGSLSGTITAGTAQCLSGSSLLAGGAPYFRLLSKGLFSLAINDIVKGRPPLETALLLAMLQTLLDGGDPINYPSRYENHAARPQDLLIWEAIGDPIVTSLATDLQAIEFGAVLAQPANHPVEQMAEMPLPISGNFSWPDETLGQATRVLRQREFPELPSPELHSSVYWDLFTHEVTAACFAGRVATGVCEVAQ